MSTGAGVERTNAVIVGCLARLLVITPDYAPGRGGVQLLTRGLVEQLGDLEPVVVARRRAGDQAREQAFDAAAPYAVRRSPAIASRAAELGALNALAAAQALRTRPRTVLSMHVLCAPAAILAQRLTGARLVQYLHADEVPHRAGFSRAATRSADATVAVSAHTAALARGCGAPAERLHVIHPGVDLPPRPDVPRATRPTIVTVARLEDAYKGHDVVLDALPAVLAAVPDAQWVVVGDGSLRPGLEARAAERGVAEAVRFLGAVDDATRDAWLERAHVFTMPSRLPGGSGGGEGFGIVYLEAGHHELPVVSGAAGGALDAVRDGETGLLVDPTDPAAVAGALVTLLSDRDRAARMGRAGAEHARAHAFPLVAARLRPLLLGGGERAVDDVAHR